MGARRVVGDGGRLCIKKLDCRGGGGGGGKGRYSCE